MQQLAVGGKRREVSGNNGIPVAAEIDTRALVRHLAHARRDARRSVGRRATCRQELIDARPSSASMAGLDLATRVSTHARYSWDQPVAPCSPSDRWRSRAEQSCHVVAFDYGIKRNILRRLVHVGARVTVVPAQTTAEDVLALKPDGSVSIQRPGRSRTAGDSGAQVRKLIGKKPIFGICLGHRSSGLALGGKTYKLKFGHRGANHPVLNRSPKKVEITSHNHGFAVDPDSLNLNEVELTHINLNDQTLEGFRHRNEPVFCVQYHPEAAPGPHDSHYLFDDFMKMMQSEARCPHN